MFSSFNVWFYIWFINLAIKKAKKTMKTTYTLGPWKWDFIGKDSEDMPILISDAGIKIMDLGNYANYYPTEGTMANEADAKLIAAAPELLEALQLVRTYMIAHIPEKIFNIVDTAIQKATSND